MKISKSSYWIYGKNFQLLSSLLLFSGTLFAREFVPERPDKVRTAYTIVKGRLAIEPELINYAVQSEDDMHTFIVGEVFIRAGISKNSELQINTDSYVDETIKNKTHKTNGDTELAWKYNLVGNDEGSYAIAIQPYVLIPTRGADESDRKWEGGLALNWEWEFAQDYMLGLTVEPNNVRKDKELDWQSSLMTAVSLGAPLFTEKLLGYLEIFNEFGKNEDQPQITTLNTALQYKLSSRFMLDIGTYIGVSPDADDLESFIGGSYLF